MKIDIVGNHCTWTKELCTSFIINNNMLFDIPLGSFSTLYYKYDLTKINFIVISHFHSDHFGDIILFLELIRKLDKTITILAPKTCKQRIEMMMRATDLSKHLPALQKINFINAENGKIVNMGEYKIKCFSVTHDNLDAYGYVIDEGVKVGFSGDSCMCNNIRKIAKISKVMFIDCSDVIQNSKHLASHEVAQLVKEFPDTIFYPVHLSQKSQATLEQFSLNQTYEGQIINVE